MRAVTFQAPGEVAVEERPEPELQEAGDAIAGDVVGTGCHAVKECGMQLGDVVAGLGLGPVGLCAAQVALASGAAKVFAVDTVAERLEVARALGAEPVHLTEQDAKAQVVAA